MKLIHKSFDVLFHFLARVICILAALTISTQVLAGAAIAADVEHAGIHVDSVTSPERPSAATTPDRQLKIDYSTTPVALQVTLQPASAPQPSTTESKGGPFQVAFYREIPEELQGNPLSRLAWTVLDDGSIVSSMSVTSPGAVHIRLGLHIELPAGGEIRFFDPNSSQHFYTITETSITGTGEEDRTLWSPLVQGDSLGVEVVLPSSKSLSTFTLSVERISHGYIDPLGLSTGGAKSAIASRRCHNHRIDVACRVATVNYDTVRSVARILVQTSNGGIFCSGTLMADGISGLYMPFFLTAYHCISTQEEADSVVAWWNYKHDVCDGSGISQIVASDHLGAELLDFSSRRDSALLRFRGTMPGLLGYSGWDSRTISAGTPVYGLHHPDGEVMQYSSGRAIGRHSYDLSGLSQYVHEAYVVDWSQGASEPGSSGSGLFNSQNRLIGVNSAWDEICGGRAFYGPFSDFWPVVDRWFRPREATTLTIPSIIVEDVDPDANDYFRIDVPGEGTLRVETAGTVDTVGTLFGRAEQRANDDNSGSGRNFRISQDILPGTYHLEVRGIDVRTRGSYALQVVFAPHEDDHANVPEKATHVPIPSSTAGRLERIGDVDYFRIATQRHGLLRIETAGSIDTVGTLLLNGAVLARDDDGGDESNFRIVSEVQAGSHYIVKVQGYARQVGGYTLGAQFEEEIGPESVRSIPLFMAAGVHLEGFVRIINRSDRAGTVEIRAIDETGQLFGPISLSIDARRAAYFNSEGLEKGNPEQGLSGGIGPGGTGHWRLELSSELDIVARAYNRSPDGFLTSIHEVVEEIQASNDSYIYYVAFFNPGRNASRVSVLRLINRSDQWARIYIAGLDDMNQRGPPVSEGDLRLDLGPREAVAFTAQELEQGDSDFSGHLGEGMGKWQLWVTSNRALHVMSLLRSSNGNVANLSR